MIMSKDLLYLHIPKTGGVSTRTVLTKNLDGPILSNFNMGIENQHLSFAEIKEAITPYGWSTDNVKRIIATIRNPYAVEVSFYFFFNKVYGKNESYTNQVIELACRKSFSEFCKGNTWPSFWYYFTGMNSDDREKLVILKLEDNLEWKLKEVFINIGLGDRTNWTLPILNQSQHEPFETYYTPELEEIVYNKYKRVFDEGWYERMKI